MDTIRPYIWIGVWVSLAVCLLWLLLGGLFSAVSSIVPYAWVIIVVAIVVGMVAWVLRYPATEINTLGENKIVWGIFQTVLVIGFVVLFIQGVFWVRDGALFSWIGIDLSPQTRMFISLVAVALVLFSFSPMFNWVIPTEGVFAKAVFRVVVAVAGVLLFASIHSPKAYFNPVTGNPVVKLDSEGNEYRDPLKVWSPATGEKLEYITPEQAKKTKPWWERWWATVEKWNTDRRASAEAVPKIATTSELNTDCTRVQREDGIISGNHAMRSMFVENRCKGFFFEQHTYKAVVRFSGNPCKTGERLLFQKVSGTPQLSGKAAHPIQGWLNLDSKGTEVTDWREGVWIQKAVYSPFTSVTKVSCVS